MPQKKKPPARASKPRAKPQTTNADDLKEAAFVLEYLHNGMNAVRAYMTVNPDSDYGSARVLASRLLAKVHIRERISAELEGRVMGRAEALARLSAQARADIDDFVNEDGSFDLGKARALQATGVIKKLKVTERLIQGEDDSNGEKSVHVLERAVEAELHNSQHALEVVLKTHGAMIDRHVHSGKVAITSLADLISDAPFDDG